MEDTTVYFPTADGKYYEFLGRRCVSSPNVFIEFASVRVVIGRKNVRSLDVALLVTHRLIVVQFILKIYNARETIVQRLIILRRIVVAR